MKKETIKEDEEIVEIVEIEEFDLEKNKADNKKKQSMSFKESSSGTNHSS